MANNVYSPFLQNSDDIDSQHITTSDLSDGEDDENEEEEKGCKEGDIPTTKDVLVTKLKRNCLFGDGKDIIDIEEVMKIEYTLQRTLTQKTASRIYGIPTSTLSDRVLKKNSNKKQDPRQINRNPNRIENQACKLSLRVMEKWCWGLFRKEVLDVAQEFTISNNLDTSFKNGRPGPDWFISFRQRHNLSIKKPQAVEYVRRKMTDPFVIHEYFALLQKTFRDLNLTDPKRIWNLDETSICLDPTKTKVVGAKGKP
ncbi:unnamed protein product [Parnassius apollo]|uniref:(apollo) hypothetical protein n=1 Tax=Parnassius apollo TaxID=110799 RepID=A0A8S3XV71_PARAO|nr:unnamed protein product [Parnassius apollo]